MQANNLKDIIDQLESIIQESDSKLIIHKKPGLSKYNAILDWPKDYIDFLAYSNGFSVGEYYNCRFFPLEKVLELTNYEHQLNEELNKLKLARIASYYDDSIYLGYNTKDGNVYYSLEGIDDPVNLNLSFVEFMQKCIDNNFQVFWADSESL